MKKQSNIISENVEDTNDLINKKINNTEHDICLVDIDLISKSQKIRFTHKYYLYSNVKWYFTFCMIHLLSIKNSPIKINGIKNLNYYNEDMTDIIDELNAVTI